MVKPGRRRGIGGGGPWSQQRLRNATAGHDAAARGGGRMRAGALVSPCHVMAGLVPAIHVFARSSTDLAERDARNKSGHDERSGRTGETARLTQSHANFRIGTLARLSNQGCGLRGDFWPHREGNGASRRWRRRRAGPRPRWATAGPSAQPAIRLSHRSRPAQPRPATAPKDRERGDYLRCPEGPDDGSDYLVEVRVAVDVGSCRRERAGDTIGKLP